MQRYFWIARETCHTNRSSSSSSIGAWYRASLTHSHSQRKSGREALLQKQNHASAAFIFLICAFLLSVAQYLNDDEVYVTTEPSMRERERGEITNLAAEASILYL